MNQIGFKSQSDGKTNAGKVTLVEPGGFQFAEMFGVVAPEGDGFSITA
jgi:hypothetical protein